MMDEILDLKQRLQEQRPAAWESLPDISLYMDQVLALMNRQTIRFHEEDGLTAAMVNNYIKDGALPRAAGKRYSETHLAYLTMICVLKQVLPVRDVTLLTRSAMDGDGTKEHYEHFCQELDEALKSADQLLSQDLEQDDLTDTATKFALLSYAYGLVSRRLTALERQKRGEEEHKHEKKLHRRKKEEQEKPAEEE